MNTDKKLWRLNTSNKKKLEEFKHLFAAYDIEVLATDIDLKEIVADPLTVVVHKASQMGEGILVEDTSLDVEGMEMGVNVRWLLDHLKFYVGRKAYWRVMLAYHHEEAVYVFKGEVEGEIVLPRAIEKAGEFGFDPYFLPKGSSFTLAESKPDAINARAKAVQALINHKPEAVLPPIRDWKGAWQ